MKSWVSIIGIAVTWTCGPGCDALQVQVKAQDDGTGDAGTGTDADTDADTDSDSDSDSDTDDECEIPEDEFELPFECSESAPPDSFEPEIQWIWTGEPGLRDATTTPLVANLDDDNDDGSIDQCDIPEVIVLVYDQWLGVDGQIAILAGDTGELTSVLGEDLARSIAPAVGDLDGDGRADIVAVKVIDLNQRLVVAYDADGEEIFVGDEHDRGSGCALALADLDNDGDVEIFGTGTVYDHQGHGLFDTPLNKSYPANVAADLDGDGDLEVITGAAAVHHDGAIYYERTELPGVIRKSPIWMTTPNQKYLLTTEQGFVLEHDGSTKLGPLTPTGDPVDGFNWERPAVIHDFDADGLPEFGQSSRSHFATYERDGALRWSAVVADDSGLAAATAFDFLGDGSAEAMYADESTMFIFDDDGLVELQMPRSSGTWIEYPVVVDVDNDGSAEIVIVSNRYQGDSPTVQVIRDVEERWIQARRIWNQHTYHVTNVHENGTIPQFEIPSWELFNTYRTNIQIENGQLCDPVLE